MADGVVFKFLQKHWGGSADNRKKILESKLKEAEGETPKADPTPASDTSDDSEYETTPEGMRRKKIRF